MTEKRVTRFVEGSNVAILSLTFSSHSGIAEVVHSQASALANSGFGVTVFCFEADVDTDQHDVVTLYSPENDNLNRIFRVIWPILLFPMIMLAKSLGEYDTVISHKYPFNVACSVSKWVYGTYYIYYDHGVAPPSLYDKTIPKGYSAVMERAQAWSARPADVVIAISEYVSEELVAVGGPPVTSIIYNTPPDNVHQYDSRLRDIREQHDIPTDAPILLFVGRITRHKNVHCLLTALNHLSNDDGITPYLVIVGKPTQREYFDWLRELSREKVRFAGYVQDRYLASYYSQADVYTTASLWEGCNLTVLEAQEMELPVVAFDTGAHPETVEVPPGRLVPTGDCISLAKEIRNALNRPEGKDS